MFLQGLHQGSGGCLGRGSVWGGDSLQRGGRVIDQSLCKSTAEQVARGVSETSKQGVKSMDISLGIFR